MNSNDNNKVELLRIGLAANAAFSLATGLVLAIAPGSVGGWLGVEVDPWLRLFGLGLIGHAAVLAFAVRQERPDALGKLNLAMIAPYPLIMIGLVAFGLVDRNVGQGLVLLDGAIIGLIAIVQGFGLRNLGTTTGPLADATC